MGYERVDRNEPLEGERELWAFGTGKVPRFFRRWTKYKDFPEYLKKLDGFEGVHFHDRGTLLMFASENQAIRAKNLMKADGYPVSKEIGKVFVDAKIGSNQESD